ncbi:flagellar basal body rod protein FlgB [Undibacterium sp. 14-3-2]|uniref:flagellar basal body rod protein FlgB n=1 Tax=Undibacterium sp. 14-3-2 TaxID=2800129 RepID=UPI0019041B53|nr:flagellar basal body rod protein FlgB [Undibacterium sp. 14-3-2]MBK1891931.1 flagellar basal body rod protein FlgB [Undibacterium sp. 14-3-2]
MDNVKGGSPSVFNGWAKEDFWESALRISEKRLTVLASNIANADTPNYNARDIDFRASLQQAITANALMTAEVELSGIPTKKMPFAATLMYRIPMQVSVDGNTVEMNTERTAFADQAIRHEFLIQKVLDEYKEIESLFKNMIE